MHAPWKKRDRKEICRQVTNLSRLELLPLELLEPILEDVGLTKSKTLHFAF